MIFEENAFDFSISSSRGARYRLSTDKAAAAMASEIVQTSLNWLQPLKKLSFFFFSKCNIKRKKNPWQHKAAQCITACDAAITEACFAAACPQPLDCWGTRLSFMVGWRLHTAHWGCCCYRHSDGGSAHTPTDLCRNVSAFAYLHCELCYTSNMLHCKLADTSTML